jgi:hypothetical protein
MKQVLVSDGDIQVGDVPAPTPDPGEVLVAVEHLTISAGTETTVVERSNMSMFREVLIDPENFKRGIELLREQGFWQKKRSRRSEMGLDSAATGIIARVSRR